jgi:tetratricopeptide (TPR) repeat protein
MISLRTVRGDDVLGRATAEVRSWQTSDDGGPVESLPPAQADRFLFGIDRLLVFLSAAARRKNHLVAARLFVEPALAFNPHSAKAHIALALVLRRKGLEAEALSHLLSAVQRDGKSKRGNWELARLLLRIERDDASPDAVARYRSRLLSALGAAVTSNNRSIRAEASVALSNVLHDLGDEGAYAAAEDACALRPDNPRALRAKANALTLKGDFASARALYNRLSADEPENPELARRAKTLPNFLQGEANGIPRRTRSSSDPAPLLIALGGGIGDMLHVTPMLRNLAMRTGSPPDVLVAADYPDVNFLFRNGAYVSSIWNLSAQVLEQRYKTIFLTYSFGTWRLPFNAEQVLISRAWRPFRAGHLNETVFNLEAAKALLGIPYEPQDATRYFVGEFIWTLPPRSLVGLHAGSKRGRWVSKRWPHFPELVARLKARGIAVASFGTSDEYVEGSENRTGGSIEEMSRSMLDCSVFVSNDSGPMHIASAMGMPVIGLYAPTDPFTHLPLGSNVTALALEKFCAPCEVKDHAFFTTGACSCVSEIPVQSVEQMVIELLGAAADQAGILVGAS